MTTSLTGKADPIRQGREIFLHQLTCAIGQLGDSSRPVNVHGARKQLKRARATLRLLRGALADGTYEHENAALRDTTRPLSSVRDSEVLIGALDGVVKRFGEAGASLKLTALRRALKEHRSSLAASGAKPQQMAKIRAGLEQIQTRAHRWKIERDGWSALEQGFRQSYRNSRRAMKIARASPTTDNLHAWRKRSKYLWHQLQIMEPLSSNEIGEVADEVHRLSDCLGDEHDLAVLAAMACGSQTALEESTRGALRELIERRRAELQGKSFALGERLYADAPKKIAKRFRHYWSQWA